MPTDKRVRVRVNGRADGGVLVLVGPETTDEEFIAAAAKKAFKRDAAAAAAVEPAIAKIYLPGGEFEADLETIMHDEEVVVAFRGSPYKHKQMRPELRSEEPAGTVQGSPSREPVSTMNQELQLPAALPMREPQCDRVPADLPMHAAAAGGSSDSTDFNFAITPMPAASPIPAAPQTPVSTTNPAPLEDSMELDAEAALPTPPRLSVDEMIARLRAAENFQGFDVHIQAARTDGTEVKRTATLVKRRDGWRLETGRPREVVVEGASLDRIEALVRDGTCLPSLVAPSVSSDVQAAAPAGKSMRRRTPEEVRAARQKLIDEGIVIVDDPRIPSERSVYDMICVCCDTLISGSKPLSDAAFIEHETSSKGHVHKAAAERMRTFTAVLGEERLASTVADEAEHNGKSALHLYCAVCRVVVRSAFPLCLPRSVPASSPPLLVHAYGGR